MPNALQVDWTTAQSLYLAKVPNKEIACRIGVTEPCLRQHAHRHGWSKLRRQVEETASLSGQRARETPADMEGRSTRLREKLAAELERQVDCLASVAPKSPGELAGRSGRAAVAGVLAAASSKVCGWNDAPQVGLVVVGSTSSFRLDPQLGAVPAEPLD